MTVSYLLEATIVASGLKQCLVEGGDDVELDVAQMEKLFLSLA